MSGFSKSDDSLQAPGEAFERALRPALGLRNAFGVKWFLGKGMWTLGAIWAATYYGGCFYNIRRTCPCWKCLQSVCRFPSIKYNSAIRRSQQGEGRPQYSISLLDVKIVKLLHTLCRCQDCTAPVTGRCPAAGSITRPSRQLCLTRSRTPRRTPSGSEERRGCMPTMYVETLM